VDAIWQGLSLSALGISLTFAALGVLILAMFLLERIFRTRRLIPEEWPPEEMPAHNSLARDMGEEEIVVAIAVALAHLRSLDMERSGLGEALEAGHGPWGSKHITRGSR
jgi:Na+-transporting methylmalonyl-CoA/oxaloacetate decarboxylase gamma subunit